VRLNQTLVIRYSLLVRVTALVPCFVLAAAIAKGSVSTSTILVMVAVLCLATLICARRVEIDSARVRVRYAPFYTRDTPVRDIIHLVEDRTLILVTATSRIHLWGISDSEREALFQILPHRLDVEASSPRNEVDTEASVRKHMTWTIIAAIGFLATAIVEVPFFEGNVWHRYWNSVGQHLLLLCLLFFIAMVFEAGFTWVLWSSKREISKIENQDTRRRP